jgi:hypothetical protein
MRFMEASEAAAFYGGSSFPYRFAVGGFRGAALRQVLKYPVILKRGLKKC